MQISKKIDYQGQKVFIGLDSHLSDWKATFLTEFSNQKTVVIRPPLVDNLISYATKHYPNADFICAYEAGFSGFWAQRALSQSGFPTIIVNPADIPTTNRDTNFKNDKRDSRKIARSLRSGELVGIYCPTVIEDEDRLLLRVREQIAKVERQVKNRIKSKLHYLGIEVSKDLGSKYWSMRFVSWLEQIAEQRKLTPLKHQLDLLKVVRQQHSEILRSLRKLSRHTRHQEVCAILQTAPGIGVLSSIKLKLELFSMERFSTTEKMVAYIGLIPTSKSSGQRNRMGKMTNRGNKMISKTLTEVAWVAIKHDQKLGIQYQEWKKRMGANKAIIKVAVKLARKIRYMWQHKQAYNYDLS